MSQNYNKQIVPKLRFVFILFVYIKFMDNAKVALIGGFCIVAVLSAILVFY